MSVSGIKLPTQSHILPVDNAGGKIPVISCISCGKGCICTVRIEAAYPISVNYDVFLK